MRKDQAVPRVVRLDLNGKETLVRAEATSPLPLGTGRRMLFRDEATREWRTCDLTGKHEKRIGDGLVKAFDPAVDRAGKVLLLLEAKPEIVRHSTLILSIAAATLAGCSGLPSLDAERAAWPPDAVGLEATNLRVFGEPSCTGARSHWEVTFASRALTFGVCEYGTDGGTGLRPAAGALSQAQLDALVTSLTALTVTSRTFCGADKDELHLVALQPSGGRVRFKDDFSACAPEAETTVVSGMDAVFVVLRDASR